MSRLCSFVQSENVEPWLINFLSKQCFPTHLGFPRPLLVVKWRSRKFNHGIIRKLWMRTFFNCSLVLSFLFPTPMGTLELRASKLLLWHMKGGLDVRWKSRNLSTFGIIRFWMRTFLKVIGPVIPVPYPFGHTGTDGFKCSFMNSLVTCTILTVVTVAGS